MALCSNRVIFENFLCPDETEIWYGSYLLSWLLNWFLIIGCIIGVFLYGDPIVQSKSTVASKFWAHHKQADYYLSKVSF